MLYDIQTGKQVFIPKNKELTEHQYRTTVEKHDPLPTKHDRFFRLEERARIVKQ